MASSLAPLPAVPPAQEPVINPKTGIMTVVWYQYFVALDAITRDSQRRLTAGGL